MMKWLLFLLLITTYIGKAQDVITKRANVIIVSTSGTANDLYKIAGQTLIEQGFSIDKSNSDFNSFSTRPRSYIGGRTKIVLDVSAKDNEVKFTGMFQSNVDSAPVTVIEYRGMQGSPFMASFEAMDKAAKSVADKTGGKVLYLKQ